MPTYLTPGVYLDVFQTSDVPPRGYRPPASASDEPITTPPQWVADHSAAAFVGRIPAGPIGVPVLVNGWRQFEASFARYSETHDCVLERAVRGFFANGGRSCWVVRTEDEFHDSFMDGLNALGTVDDVSAVCAPDIMQVYSEGGVDLEWTTSAQLQLIAHCEQEGTRMALLDPPPAMAPQDVGSWRIETAGYDTRHAALYYPWIEVLDPDSGRPVAMPPCGHVAGVYARSDLLRGPHHTPANEPIQEALGVAFPVRRFEQATLNPVGINVLAPSPRGVLLWGSRTLSSDPQWRHLRLERLMSFIGANLMSGMRWAIFRRSDDRQVWARIVRELEMLFGLLWRSGALRGDLPEEAYRVRCDEDTNPEEVTAAGQIVAECAIAPDAGSWVSFRVVFYCDG
jgi:hypothetical protein